VPDERTAVEILKQWQRVREQRLSEFDVATREYAELNALLDGGTLLELDARSSELRRRERELAAVTGDIPDLAGTMDLDKAFRDADASANTLERSAHEAEIRANERARELPSVTEAEEELSAAADELKRVQALGKTLDLTLTFLKRAEERVHRDIAPVLAAGLRQSLAQVTGGRYTDARVDPSELSVQVLGRDGQWRKAQHLSHGAAEQIYLLLRITLAERLTARSEICPIILDDVLVQCDRDRKRALLDVLLRLASTRQVILFTQEEEVLRWAREFITAPNELLVLQGVA
jgi:uncharacterized protein YhaN